MLKPRGANVDFRAVAVTSKADSGKPQALQVVYVRTTRVGEVSFVNDSMKYPFE